MSGPRALICLQHPPGDTQQGSPQLQVPRSNGAQLQPPTQRGHPSPGTQGSTAHCPPPQDWCHTHMQDKGAPRHPVNGFVQQRCGERGDVSSRPPRGLGPSPSRESQHCTPQGQGGESKHPETPPGLHRALGKCPGSVPRGDRDGWTTTSLPRGVRARETTAGLEPGVRAELSAGSFLMPDLILGLCPAAWAPMGSPLGCQA